MDLSSGTLMNVVISDASKKKKRKKKAEDSTKREKIFWSKEMEVDLIRICGSCLVIKRL